MLKKMTIKDIPDIQDFAKVRNQHIENIESIYQNIHDRGEDVWGLFVDSDEEMIASENLENWLDLIPESCGFAVYIESDMKLYGKDEHIKANTSMLRLFKLHQGYRYRHRIHEDIGMDIIEKGGHIYTIPRSLLYIVHHGYNTFDKGIEQKCERNIRILKQMIEDKEDEGFAWYHLGRTYNRLNQNEQGDTCWRMALATGELRGTYLSNVILYLKAIDEQTEYLRHSEQNNESEISLS